MKTALFTSVFWKGVLCVAALAEGAPKIQFDQLVYDFGKVSEVETVSGKFEFSNIGEGILKVEAPKPSCGCTVAGLKPDTLKPGESGELGFTLNLGRSKAVMEKHITVTSNDPQAREVSLTIRVDYTPLYDVNPMTLSSNLPLGTSVINQFTTLTRTDGKPLRIAKLEPSKPWIKAQLEPGAKPDESTARVRVEIQRDGPPRRFNESIQVYAAGQPDSPVATIYVYGLMVGEVSLTPEILYWSIIDPGKIKTERPETIVTRRLTIQSTHGRAFQIMNPRSTLKGITLEIVKKESAPGYELVATLDDIPDATLSGNVSFETSVPTQSRIDVPVIVNVFRP
jgi:hypothetical protein